MKIIVHTHQDMVTGEPGGEVVFEGENISVDSGEDNTRNGELSIVERGVSDEGFLIALFATGQWTYVEIKRDA